jgi:hypothetical protein
MFFISATLLARFWQAFPKGKVPVFYLTYSANDGQVNERSCIFHAFAVSFTARGRPARQNQQPKSPQDGTMSKKIPDFTDSQIWTVESTLVERFKEKIETQNIDEIEDCIISPLRVQADHTSETQQESESTN